MKGTVTNYEKVYSLLKKYREKQLKLPHKNPNTDFPIRHISLNILLTMCRKHDNEEK